MNNNTSAANDAIPTNISQYNPSQEHQINETNDNPLMNHDPQSNTFNANPFVVDENLIDDHNRLSYAMVEMISKTLSMTTSERILLDDFILAARNLDLVLDGRAQTHGILTLLDPSIAHGRQAVAPVHSKELLPAIDRRNFAVSSASVALADLFLVACSAKQIGRSKTPSSTVEHASTFPSDERLPSWLNNNAVSIDETQDMSVKHLKHNDAVMRGINQFCLNDLSSVYGDFFNQVWDICKKKLGWKGQVMYKKMTPP